MFICFFFFKQKTAYEMRISDWSSDVCSSDLTTTIAKLAHLFTEQDYSVMLAAGDTFRAAAIEQLQTWGDRAGVRVVSGKEGADAAGLVFDAHSQAKASGVDVLIVDTAGRLQNKQGRSEEHTSELQSLMRISYAVFCL